MSAVMHGPLQRGGAGNRALNYAIVASVAFHGALLLALSAERQARREAVAPGPIVARLAPPVPVSQPPQQPAQPEPPKPRVEPPPKPAPPVVKPVPLPKASPSPRKEASVSPPPVAPPQPAPPSAEPSPSAPAAPAAPSAPAAAARADPQPSPSPSSSDGTLEIYRMELMRMARNYKRYPRVALDNNWEGRVIVRMVIGANGMIASLTVVSSAGHEILDKQALDMLQKAKPRVQIPPALRGKEFSIEIPVIYNLKDQASG
jgi:protein TonB